MYILLETLNIPQTEHNVFNRGSHVAYRENCNFWIRSKEMDIMEDECLVCQKDPSRVLLSQLISFRHSFFNGSHHIEGLFWEVVIVTYMEKKNPTAEK